MDEDTPPNTANTANTANPRNKKKTKSSHSNSTTEGTFASGMSRFGGTIRRLTPSIGNLGSRGGTPKSIPPPSRGDTPNSPQPNDNNNILLSSGLPNAEPSFDEIDVDDDDNNTILTPATSTNPSIIERIGLTSAERREAKVQKKKQKKIIKYSRMVVQRFGQLNEKQRSTIVSNIILEDSFDGKSIFIGKPPTADEGRVGIVLDLLPLEFIKQLATYNILEDDEMKDGQPVINKLVISSTNQLWNVNKSTSTYRLSGILHHEVYQRCAFGNCNRHVPCHSTVSNQRSTSNCFVHNFPFTKKNNRNTTPLEESLVAAGKAIMVLSAHYKIKVLKKIENLNNGAVSVEKADQIVVKLDQLSTAHLTIVCELVDKYMLRDRVYKLFELFGIDSGKRDSTQSEVTKAKTISIRIKKGRGKINTGIKYQRQDVLSLSLTPLCCVDSCYSWARYESSTPLCGKHGDYVPDKFADVECSIKQRVNHIVDDSKRAFCQGVTQDELVYDETAQALVDLLDDMKDEELKNKLLADIRNQRLNSVDSDVEILTKVLREKVKVRILI